MAGVPVTYTVEDTTAGRVLETFVEPAGVLGTCGIAVTQQYRGLVTYQGEPELPYHGCAFTGFVAPGDDILVIRGSFAGNESYAPSESPAEPFPG
ncbi:MAG TPA: hypothetical protein VMB91_13665 [Solirubrobacteraceae bacterium]|nr:hypothetical protein [Solirubrobacteraceae bacterium]